MSCFNEFAFTVQVKHKINSRPKQILGFILICLYFATGHFHACVLCKEWQGGILSPILFCRYIRDLLHDIAQAGIGCNIGGVFINILAYADDIVLLAPPCYT